MARHICTGSLNLIQQTNKLCVSRTSESVNGHCNQLQPQVGTDIRDMTPVMRQVLLNEELIAINQDYRAPPGDALVQSSCSSNTVWVRHLSDGRIAVAATNYDTGTHTVSVCFKDVGWVGAAADVRDVYGNLTVHNVTAGQYSRSMAEHDTLLLILQPATPAPPPPPMPAQCSVQLTQQQSKRKCVHQDKLVGDGEKSSDGSYGCTSGTWDMWVDGGCRGVFECDGVPGVACSSGGEHRVTCSCKPSYTSI